MPVERRGRVIAVELGPTGLYPGRSPKFRRKEGGSLRAMARAGRCESIKSGSCEGLGVKFPGPTRQPQPQLKSICGRSKKLKRDVPPERPLARFATPAGSPCSMLLRPPVPEFSTRRGNKKDSLIATGTIVGARTRQQGIMVDAEDRGARPTLDHGEHSARHHVRTAKFGRRRGSGDHEAGRGGNRPSATYLPRPLNSNR
jgi:hypothetical protein